MGRMIEKCVKRGVEYVLEVAYEGMKNWAGEDMTTWHIVDNTHINQWGGRALIRQGKKAYIMRIWKKEFIGA